MSIYQRLDAWIDQHFDEQVQFLQALVRVPTDTPPGNNAPHAERTAELIQGYGFDAEKHAVPEADVQAYGMQSITNLIVRRPYGQGGRTVALNAHGDVVPPGEGWTHDPYGAEIADGAMYGRATAVSKSDFSTFTFAVRALEAVARPAKGSIELHFTYDEEFGGLLGPGWLLEQGLTKPDLMIAAGFCYEVVTAHNGCLQMEVTVHGKMAHAAVPHTGVDALQGATDGVDREDLLAVDDAHGEEGRSRFRTVDDMQRQRQVVAARQLTDAQPRVTARTGPHGQVADPEVLHASRPAVEPRSASVPRSPLAPPHVAPKTRSQLPPRMAPTAASSKPRATRPRVTLSQP